MRYFNKREHSFTASRDILVEHRFVIAKATSVSGARVRDVSPVSAQPTAAQRVRMSEQYLSLDVMKFPF